MGAKAKYSCSRSAKKVVHAARWVELLMRWFTANPWAKALTYF